MKRLFDFFLFSNIYISFCASILCLFSFELLEIKENRVLICFFIFFSTLSAYNFHRLRGINGMRLLNRRTVWMKKHFKSSTAFSIASLIIAIALYFFLPNSTIILLLPLTLICLWYAVGLIGNGKLDRPLREVPFLKIFLIAFVWTGACLIFPAVSLKGYEILSTIELQLIAITYGCFIFSLTLPFDIRDLSDDLSLDIQTIPTAIGVTKTKMLSSLGFFFAAISMILLHFYFQINLASALAFICSCLIALLLVLHSSPQKSEYYFSFLLESTLLLPFLLLQLFRYFQ